MRMEIRVVANAKRDCVEEGPVLTVYIGAKPEKNEANFAVMKILSQYFGKPVRIVGGLKGRKKTIEF